MTDYRICGKHQQPRSNFCFLKNEEAHSGKMVKVTLGTSKVTDLHEGQNWTKYISLTFISVAHQSVLRKDKEK